MKALHKAATRRAYRTLAQGLGSSAVTTAATAALAGGRATLLALAVAIGTTVLAAAASFWQGVAAGLPEVAPLTIARATVELTPKLTPEVSDDAD